MNKRDESDKFTLSKAFNLAGVTIFELRERGIDTSYENILEELKIDINDRIKANEVYKALTMLVDYGYIEKRACKITSCYFFIGKGEELVRAFIKRKIADLESRRKR